jgi:hypothetical protein
LEGESVEVGFDFETVLQREGQTAVSRARPRAGRP